MSKIETEPAFGKFLFSETFKRYEENANAVTHIEPSNEADEKVIHLRDTHRVTMPQLQKRSHARG
jgi:hypothetical protein